MFLSFCSIAGFYFSHMLILFISGGISWKNWCIKHFFLFLLHLPFSDPTWLSFLNSHLINALSKLAETFKVAAKSCTKFKDFWLFLPPAACFFFNVKREKITFYTVQTTFHWHARLFVLSRTEIKDWGPPQSFNQRREGSAQDQVSFPGKLQHKLPASPQTGDFRRNHWPLARSQQPPLEVCFILRKH